ncbi:restriction endonuclease subunit S [Siphonobacter sp. BAB-5385]|uniref:restriction endonuclease subunit S n=1 Tax=Siphonobacter sp. BAB-5385 TaxID=1864822 RepID=UPI001594FCB3|nr:restriction endonuclease subunit S [Siphonobacter sp. BAB-5385]
MKLGEVCKMNSGGTPSRSNSEFYENGTIPWAKISDIETAQGGYIIDTEEKITEKGLASINNRIFEENTLLLAMYGSVGKVGITACSMSTNQAILGIRPNHTNQVDLQYLKFWFVSQRDFLLNRAVGGTLQNISLGIVKSLEIPLPPLSEQKRIAAILDQADELRQKDRQLLQHYNQLIQSTFLEMFGDPVSNPMGWEVKKLGDFGIARLGKMLDSKKQTGNNTFPYLGNSNVLWGRFKLNNLAKMDFSEDEREEFKLRPGDLLICEGGEVGRCAIWKDQLTDIYFQKAIHRLRLNLETADPLFIQFLFRYYCDNNQLKDFVTISTIAHLTGVKLKQIPFILPPIQLQNEFAQIVTEIEEQKEIVQRQLESSEALFQSLLSKAFAGEV